MTFPCIAVTNYELIFANSHFMMYTRGTPHVPNYWIQKSFQQLL